MTKLFFEGYDLQFDPELARLARVADEVLTGHLQDMEAAGTLCSNGRPLAIERFNMPAPVDRDNFTTIGQVQCLGHALRALKLKTPEKAIKAAITKKNILTFLESLESTPKMGMLDIIGLKRTCAIMPTAVIFGRRISFEMSERSKWIRDSFWPANQAELDAYGQAIVDEFKGYQGKMAVINSIEFKLIRATPGVWNPHIYMEFEFGGVPIAINHPGHCGQKPYVFTRIIMQALSGKDVTGFFKPLLGLIEQAVQNTASAAKVSMPSNFRCGLMIEREALHIALSADKLTTSLRTEVAVICMRYLRGEYDSDYRKQLGYRMTLESVRQEFEPEIAEAVTKAQSFARRQKILNRKSDDGMLEKCMVTNRIVEIIGKHDPELAKNILQGKIQKVDLPIEVYAGFFPQDGKKTQRVVFSYIEGRIVSSFLIKPGVNWKQNTLWVQSVSQSAIPGLVGQPPEAIIDHPIAELIGPVSSVRSWPGSEIMGVRFQKKILKHDSKQQPAVVTSQLEML